MTSQFVDVIKENNKIVQLVAITQDHIKLEHAVRVRECGIWITKCLNKIAWNVIEGSIVSKPTNV